MKSCFTLLFVRFHVLFFLMAFSFSAIKLQAQVNNTTVFPLNDYLTTQNGNPYPVIVQSKIDAIDTSKFVNVMDYGAQGDGVTWDDDAIASAFNDAKYGVIFPANKTFLVHKLTTIHIPDRDMIVYAYGATIKMDNSSRYSFLSLEYEPNSYHNTVIWLGGKLWGTRNKQSWPGSPSGNNAWEEAHGRFLGISYAAFALVKDVSVVGTVMDGVGFESCKLAVVADSKAWGGAPLRYADVQDQGTYFKCTRLGSQAFYCINVSCDGGCIGIHYSTPYAEDNSLTVVNNCTFTNQRQNAMHFEDCKKVFIYNSSVDNNPNGGNLGDVHISNRATIVSVKSCQFTNSKVDFINGSDLQIGVVDSSQFVSEFQQGDSSLYTCLAGATHCINSSFTGTTDIEQVWADYVQNCTFNNFSGIALRGPHVAYNSYFQNGPMPMSLAKDGVVINCSYDNVGDSTFRTPGDDSWKQPFSSYIDIVSDGGVYLGRISCGSVSGNGNGNIALQGNQLTGATALGMASKRFGFAGAGAQHQTVPGTEALAGKEALSAAAVQQMTLYPNPAAAVLHVSLNGAVMGKTVLNVYDQQGRLVQSKTVYKQTQVSTESLPVSALSAGTYVLHVINEQQSSSATFIISR